MAIKTYNDQNFVAIANAIRSKNGETTQYKPSEMAAAISAIESAIEILPQDTVSGALANFPDGSDGYPVVELIANIEPKQEGSGDPSPSNVRPISGSTECNISKQGKNLLENQLETQTVNGTTFTINSDKSITVSGTPTAQTRVYISRQVYTVLAASYMSFGTMPTGTRVFCTRTAGGSTTYPTISNTHSASTIGSTYTNFLLEINTTFDGTEFTLYPQIEVGSTATAYVPYSAPEVKTIDLGRTVYCGTLNVTTGELNSSYKLTNLSGFTWEYDSTTYAFGIFQTTGNISDKAANKNFICEIYKNAGNYRGTLTDKEIGVFNNTTGLRRICIRDDSLTSLQDFENAIIGKKIAYEITTPETYSIDPETNIKTNLGVNNISADTGNVSVTYRADIDLYIAKKIAEGA